MRPSATSSCEAKSRCWVMCSLRKCSPCAWLCSVPGSLRTEPSGTSGGCQWPSRPRCTGPRGHARGTHGRGGGPVRHPAPGRSGKKHERAALTEKRARPGVGTQHAADFPVASSSTLTHRGTVSAADAAQSGIRVLETFPVPTTVLLRVSADGHRSARHTGAA